ncbi:MAG: hypothetical protein R3324_02145 [Halobacteriales archaeon]|nr:hypothetical protein [Halobacteriales archaeon]
MEDGDLTPAEQYTIIRRAVSDAVWDVIGTLALLVLAVVLILVGVGFIASGLRTGAATGLLPMVFGVVLIGVALVAVFREFSLWPF